MFNKRLQHDFTIPDAGMHRVYLLEESDTVVTWPVVNGGAEPVRLQFGNRNANIYDPILPGTLTWRIVIQNQAARDVIDAVFDSIEGDYRVEFYQVEGGVTENLIWRGDLLLDQYSEDLRGFPGFVELVANDLGKLQGLNYLTTAGFIHTGRESQLQIIKNCVDLLGYDLGFACSDAIYEDTMDGDPLTDDPMLQAFADNAWFYPVDSFDQTRLLSAWDVLKTMLISKACRIRQWGGRWWIEQIGEGTEPIPVYTECWGEYANGTQITSIDGYSRLNTALIIEKQAPGGSPELRMSRTQASVPYFGGIRVERFDNEQSYYLEIDFKEWHQGTIPNAFMARFFGLVRCAATGTPESSWEKVMIGIVAQNETASTPVYLQIENTTSRFFTAASAPADGERVQIGTVGSLTTTDGPMTIKLTVTPDAVKADLNWPANSIVQSLLWESTAGNTRPYAGVGCLSQESHLYTVGCLEYGFVDIAPPSNLIATPGDQQVALTWTPPLLGTVSGYNIYRDNVKINATPIVVTNYTDTGLTNGVEYSYKLTSIIGGTESGFSDTISATPFAAVIDFTDFSEYTTGNSPSDWTERWNVNAGVWTVQDVVGATGGKALRMRQAASALRLITWDGKDFKNGRATMRGKADTIVGAINLGLSIRTSGATSGAGNQYYFYAAETILILAKRVSGTVTTLDSESFSAANDTYYNLELSADESAIEARIYTDVQGRDGGSILSATDSSLTTSGWAGIIQSGIVDKYTDTFEIRNDD